MVTTIAYFQIEHTRSTVLKITSACFEPRNRMTACTNESSSTQSRDCCITSSVLYRGDVGPKDANEAIAEAWSMRRPRANIFPCSLDNCSFAYES